MKSPIVTKLRLQITGCVLLWAAQITTPSWPLFIGCSLLLIAGICFPEEEPRPSL